MEWLDKDQNKLGIKGRLMVPGDREPLSKILREFDCGLGLDRGPPSLVRTIG
jgi:hypothetical protein